MVKRGRMSRMVRELNHESWKIPKEASAEVGRENRPHEVIHHPLCASVCFEKLRDDDDGQASGKQFV